MTRVIECHKHLWIEGEEYLPPNELTKPTIELDFLLHPAPYVIFHWMKKTWKNWSNRVHTQLSLLAEPTTGSPLVILPEVLPSSFSNTNKSTARETPKKLLTAQFFGSAAKTGLQIRAPVPPHLTAAAFILHREFKDDTLETAVTVKLLRSFSSTHASLNDLMQMATWIFMRRMCFTTRLLGCTDKGGPVKSDALQHLTALCVWLGGKYEMDGTQSMKWMRQCANMSFYTCCFAQPF